MYAMVRNALSVFLFYLKVVRLYPVVSFGLFFSGLFTRVINLIAFVSIIKVFLIVINPESFVPLAQKYIVEFSGGYMIDDDHVIVILLFFLQFVMLLNYIVGRLNIGFFLKLKCFVGRDLSFLPIEGGVVKQRNFAIDTIPIGCENIVKIFEILFFFLLVLSVVFFVNAVVGFAVLVMIPIFILYMVYAAKKEFYLSSDYKASKVGLKTKEFSDYLDVVGCSGKLQSYRRGLQVLFQFLAGSIVTCVIAIFFILDQNEVFVSLWSIILVFGIRYIVNYAKELSGTAAKVLAARVTLQPVLKLSFADLACFVSQKK